MNIRTERLRLGTTQKLAASMLKFRFPQMSPSLLSKAEDSEITGITLTKEALLLLFPHQKTKPANRRYEHTVTLRMDTDTYTRLQQARQGRSMQDYVYGLLRSHLEEIAL